jgi:bis(5'-nucleosyl)-tetraphosphatase (symmetrical)
MATWVIGDVHGCYRTLRKLLKKIDFAKTDDRLLFVGDLVNRGPRSLEVLEWAVDHDWRIESVLGNHDLHLLALAFGVAEERAKDTLKPVLRSVRAVPLVDWLRRRPLAVSSGSFLLVHAGLLPEWTVDEALSIASRLEGRLRGEEGIKILAALRRRDDGPSDEVSNDVRSLRALSFLRALKPNGEVCRDYTGEPEKAPDGCVAWFNHPERRSRDALIVFGHWAAAGFRRGAGFVSMDTGCVWGGKLSAIRLDDGELVQVSNAE